MNSFCFKLTLITLLFSSILAQECHIGEYYTNSSCDMCQRLTANCINCDQSTGACITCKGNIPAWKNSKNTSTCTCPSNQVLGFNQTSGNIACQPIALGQEIYNNNTAILQSITNNLTLSNLQLITAIIWGCQAQQFGNDYTILTKMIHLLQNGSAILTGSISQGGNPQNTEQAIIALLGLALNPTQSFFLLQTAASLMYNLASSSTTNIEGIDYALEFYSIAMNAVSSPTFYYETGTTPSEIKSFLQMLETNANNILPILLSNIYFILPNGSPYMSSYTSIESTIVKLNTTGSQTYNLFENQFGIIISQNALSLLPQGDLYLYITVQFQNPFQNYPNITYAVESKIFNVLFFDSNYNLVNQALTGLTNTSQITLQLTLNNAIANTWAELVSWTSDLENWQASQICTQQTNSSLYNCNPSSIQGTMFSLITKSTLITSCNTGEILSPIQNKCLLCEDIIPGCLQCSGYSCTVCAGLVPGSTYTQGSCSCQNGNVLVYNITTLTYMCSTQQAVLAQYNSIDFSSFTGILTSNQIIDLIGATYINNSTILSLNGLPIFIAGINYTNTYMRPYYLQFCVAAMQQYSSYYIISQLMSVVNVLKSMTDITTEELQMIGEFYGLAMGQVNQQGFNSQGTPAWQVKNILNQLHTNLNNFKMVLAQTNQNITYHFSNIYMGVTKVQAVNNSFSASLKAGTHAIQLSSGALSKLSSQTNYLVHEVLDQFALEKYPNATISSIVSPYSVLFLDSSFKVLNNNLYNLSRSLQLKFMDYYFNSNQTLLSWSESRINWKINQAVCVQTQSNNMLPYISCFPDSIASAQLFIIEQL